jgi:hypothetical protein
MEARQSSWVTPRRCSYQVPFLLLTFPRYLPPIDLRVPEGAWENGDRQRSLFTESCNQNALVALICFLFLH